MTLRKALKRVLAVAGLVLLAWIVSNRHDLRNFPHIISAFYSKEMCSCVFVVGQTEEFCNNYARQWVPIQGMPVVDRAKKTVRVTGLLKTTEAYYTGERNGCVLRPME